MNPLKSIPVIGYASSIAANRSGSECGPIVLKESPDIEKLSFLQWQMILKSCPTERNLKAIPEVARICQKLAASVYQLTQQQKQFLVIGGDHSSAIGTWSGAAAAKNPIGLLWFDAHMDSHTEKTTLTGNVHGMPLAVLLGHGDSRLTHIQNNSVKLLPQHVCLIGIRSFEPAEKALLEKLKIRIFYMEEVQKRGLNAVLEEALTIVKKNTSGYGVTVDIDVLDPTDAPGVSTRAANGIHIDEFCNALSHLKEDTNLLGAEIVEYNPERDQDQKTAKCIVKIIETLF